jgi:sugar/nucleoside kinase (ribokinase family)
VDPTGAGDAFAGALMGALAGRKRVATGDVRAALVQASVVASFAVEDFSLGALRRLDRATIAARLRELNKMTQV